MSEHGSEQAFAEVVEGPDKGRRIPLGEGVVTLGRSSENDACLLDPILSRRHCRIEIAGGAAKVVDLDSANGTYLNGVETREAAVRDGDRIQIGDTVLRISLGKSAGVAAAAVRGPGGVVVDLGFGKGDGEAPSAAKGPNWRPLAWGLAAVAVLAAAASLIMRPGEGGRGAAIAAIAEPSPLPLEIDYEKVEAGTNSIFRYHMTLSPAGLLAVEIDDLAEDRHVRKDALVSSNSIALLAKKIDRSGFFRLGDIPAGIASEGRLATMDVTVVSGRRARRLSVENRLEPPAFREVREALETFGKNELGIWAIQYPREKLVGMARAAHTKARNLFEERGVAYGNVYQAIRAYREAAFYLETVEPKPDFYADAASGLAEAEEELSRRYEEQRFKADRAINLKDWQAAAGELRILCEQIPDGDDPRNADATRKLLDVENRLKKGGK